MEKILIVDDNVTNLDILLDLLDIYDVIESTNANSALEIIDNEDIDIILLDVMMPIIDGFEMCKILKNNPKTKHIPIIFITGKTDTNSITKGFELGGVDYITKPFNPLEIQARVKNHLKLNQTIKQLKQLSNDIMINTKFAAIGQMSAGITHEINTPLTYIKATLEMTQDDIELIEQDDIKIRLLEDNKTVIDGINRIGTIIKSMQEMSNDDKVLKSEVNIFDTITTVLIMIYNRSKYISNIYINNQLFDINNIKKSNLPFTSNIQKEKIEQVWTIILNNALDELQKNNEFASNRIDINIKQIDSKVSVNIMNNGGVISSDIINNIFEPFISNKDHSGIGIGLSVAKKIIDSHNGCIKIKCYDELTSFNIIV